MAEGRQGNADRGADSARLRDLEDRLANLLKADDGPKQQASYDQAHTAWRMVIELVAGLGLGCAIGYGLDSLLGTMPVMLIIFIFLGFAAGVKTMMRTATELGDKAGKAPGDSDKMADGPQKGERG